MNVRVQRWLSLTALVVGLVWTVGATAQSERPSRDDAMRVVFVGELLDDANQPISGVFPLTFEMYRNTEAESPVWSEQQHVAVHQGMYEVHLGRVNGIPAEWEGEERVVRVKLGELELAVQSLELTRWVPASAGAPSLRYQRLVELAGTAIEADAAAYARNCQTLQGHRVAAIDRYGELNRQLEEMRERIERPPGNRIGQESVNSGPFGGAGGARYEYRCPPGFVMTGARGGAGHLVDGFRVICTQLQ